MAGLVGWYWRLRVLPTCWAQWWLFRRAVRELAGPGRCSETVITDTDRGVELRIAARRLDVP
jgi:hypothetical protein